jgi:hypothetical protein
MGLKKRLRELKKIYSEYALLWEDWIQYEFNDLSEEDIHLINFYVAKNIGVIDYLRYRHHNNHLKSSINKLNASFPEFQEWVVLKFQFILLRLAFKMDFEIFFGTDIEHLQLSEEFKNKLKGFNAKNLDTLFRNYSEDDFKYKWFSVVKDATYLLRQENQKSEVLYQEDG